MALPQIESPDLALAFLCEGCEVSETRRETRRESLAIAIALGADLATLVKLRDAGRLSRKNTITLPRHRRENMSRGKGWARKGRGKEVSWGERDDTGYIVGPGRWTVGGNDGYHRKGETVWTVTHIAVGPQTWTVAE